MESVVESLVELPIVIPPMLKLLMIADVWSMPSAVTLIDRAPFKLSGPLTTRTLPRSVARVVA